MKRYEMNKQKEGSITYFFIRDTETWDIVLLPTKYLMHMTKAKCSPNTVRRSGCSILYYLEYIEEKEKKLTDVYEMSFTEQTKYFVEFLYWLKAGKHTSGKMNILPNNGTCNAYLKDVFRFYVFIEEEFSQFGGLKVLSYSQFTAVDSVGLKKTIRSRSFKGYLKEEEHKARTAKKDEIIEILKACTNITMKQKLPGSQKKRKLPLIKLLIVYFELNWQAYAATIGASQPSVFNFFRYAFILRSLLN